MTRRQLEGVIDSLDYACSSMEDLVARLDKLVDGGEMERVMPLVEMLDTQSLLVYHDYLLMSVEEAESGEGLDGPFQ